MNARGSKPEKRRDPGRERPQREWWHRYLEPEERRRVMTDLAIISADSWLFRFTVMLTLSVVVAVMGLSADSAAVVIGAMLLAPLMTPVLGLAASLSMALPNKITVSATRVALATGWCIGIAFVISLIIPDATLPNEVISRTSPDVRDLVVALAAGFAGSYATVRTDASAALPGVAVAVALVPPLGTVGITLEAGRPDLARGALLLYGTNLAAIILAGVLIFLITGFVPPLRLARTIPGIITGGVIAMAVVVAVAVPLIRASVSAAQTAQLQQQVDEVVGTWLQGYELEVDDVDLDNEADRVSVAISGLAFPPDKAELERLLIPVLGETVRISVQWTRTEQATTSTTLEPTSTIETDEERRLRAVLPIVEEWLAESQSDGNEYELESISLTDDDLRVDVVGTGHSPSVDDLLSRLDAGLDDNLSVRLTWIPRSVVAPVTVPDPVDVRRGEIERLVDDFADSSDLSVLRFDYDGRRIIIELAGTNPPEITDLTLEVQQIAGDGTPVTVYFVQRVPLETTTTTTTIGTASSSSTTN